MSHQFTKVDLKEDDELTEVDRLVAEFEAAWDGYEEEEDPVEDEVFDG
jgi:hypothetical protein